MKAECSVRSADSQSEDSEAAQDSVASLCDAAGDQRPICDSVAQAVERYLNDLDGTEPVALYDLVMCEVERPLLQAVLKHSCGNRSKASRYLGMSRNTLQKKLAQYKID